MKTRISLRSFVNDCRLKLYNEIGLEPQNVRRGFRKFCTFYKIKMTGLPSSLFELIPKSSHMYNTRSLENAAGLISSSIRFFRLQYQNGIN